MSFLTMELQDKYVCQEFVCLDKALVMKPFIVIVLSSQSTMILC